ncbi:MAG: C45 family autoproteolytic acyltransferase/hydrolase [Cryomorphaceae bacterium]|nr:C45 family peptidase [Flavobacteriales bacterium]
MKIRAESHYEAGLHHGAMLKLAGHPVYKFSQNLFHIFWLDTTYFLLRKSFQALQIAEEYRDEIRGISDATGIPMRRLMVANFMFDVFKGGIFCSTFNFFAPDALIARNTDTFGWLAWLSLRYEATIVFRTSVAGHLTFSQVGFALSVGVINGYNACGIALNNHMVSNPVKTRNHISRAVPTVLQFRKIMEEARNLEEVKSQLSDVCLTYPAVTLLTDCKNRTSAIFESVPGQHNFEPISQPYQACTMHFVTEKMSALSRGAFAGSKLRLNFMNKALQEKDFLDVQAASDVLKNTCHGLRRRRGGKSLTNKGTFQSFICLPMKDVLIISNGKKLPVSLNGEYVCIDFKQDL